MGEYHLDDLERDGLIMLRIFDEIAWDFTQANGWMWWHPWSVVALSWSVAPATLMEKQAMKKEEELV